MQEKKALISRAGGGAVRGDRQGGSEQEREKQTEFKTQRLGRRRRGTQNQKEGTLRAGEGDQDMKGEIEVEIERPRDAEKQQ